MMPEPNPLEEAWKPDAISAQNPGSDIVEDHNSEEQSDDRDIGNRDIGTREMSRYAIRCKVPAGWRVDIGESTPVATGMLIHDEEEAREIIDCAFWLMSEQKAQLSLSNLDTAIYLFRQVLDGCSPTHPLYMNFLRDLASALCVRVMHTTSQITDIHESFGLRADILRIFMSQEEGNNTNITATRQEDNEEIKATSQLANELFTDFKNSTSLDVLNTVIFLLEQALPHSAVAHATRMTALTALVDGLHARQHHVNDTTASDLNKAVSALMDAIGYCIDEGQKYQLGLQIVALSMEQFDFTGDISDLPVMAGEQTHSDQENTAIQKLQSASEFGKRFGKTGNMDDLNTAIGMYRECIANISEGSEIHTTCVNNLATALCDRLQQGGEQSDLDEVISLRRQALKLLPPPHPDLSFSLSHLASTLNTRFEQGGRISDLDEAISLYRQALELQPPPHPDRSMSLNNLASMLNTRFQQEGQHSDLGEAISLCRQALNLLPLPHPGRPLSLSNLASALNTQFQQGGRISDLDEAIYLHMQALELLPPSHPDRSMSLSDLASVLKTRFQQGGQICDLDEAISLLRQVLELLPLPHPDRSSSLNNLASALKTQFEQGGRISNLDEAITLYGQVLELQPPPHPDRFLSLSNLASVLNTRFEQGGRISDLDEVTSLYRQALELRPLPHPDRSMSLNNLASALKARFEQGGRISNLDEAISLYGQALELLPPSYSDRSLSLNNLASALRTRFEQGGRISDLDEAISLNRQSLELQPPLHPHRSACLNNMAVALKTRFQQGGRIIDLDEAISLYRQALEFLPPLDPDRSFALNNLASALHNRFSQGGPHSDLDEAISLYRQALEILPLPYPGRSLLLSNLASALNTRFQQGGRISDLDEAIYLNRQALESSPTSHPYRSVFLTNMAIALKTRFLQGGQHIDLDESISLNRQALELLPPPHPGRFPSLDALANALGTRFSQGGQHSDLDEAISLYRQALELLPLPHLGQSLFLNNLAGALNTRFEKGGQPSDLDEAMSLMHLATQCRFQPPSQCLNISWQWIRIAEKNQHNSLIAAYEAGLQTLPRVAALSLTVESRQQALISRSNGLARAASSYAIRLGDVAKAIEFIEAGRSVFWSQVLSLRSPFDQLRDIGPDSSILADRLQHIAQELEDGSHRQISAHILDNHTRLSIDQESFRLNCLNEEWNEIVLNVRKLRGFEDFLLSPHISSLQSTASRHPVVLLIAHCDESHCLIMSSTKIDHIPLPSLGTHELEALTRLVRMAVSDLPISRSLVDRTRNMIIDLLGEERGISFQNDSDLCSNDIFKLILEFLWGALVKPIIDLFDIKKSSEPPILQWCPTGPFTFLPIHAAGIYDANNSAIDCAADYFISSYTPTIGILLAEPSSTASQTFKMMTVVQPQQLRSTALELQKIRNHVPDNALITMGVPDSPAYVETVASQLSDVSIVHFACHGHQDESQPLNSWLKLDDGGLRISRIMKEKMPNGALAFLSACETAMGDKTLPDEAMSLAASLLFCGFRRVVATMWMMWDEDGPTVADAFYRELFRDPEGGKMLVPDVSKSAYALHVAVKELRSQKASFRRWVPFIHMGQC